MKRKDETKKRMVLKGSRKLGAERWVASGKIRSKIGGHRTDAEIMASEVVGI